jgi:DNA-binding transcriptional regulator YiaG
MLLFRSGQELKANMWAAKRKRKSPRASSAVDKSIGARIREGRRALNMPQESLGELLGTFQQVQKYESGRNRVSAARLFEIKLRTFSPRFSSAS